MEEVRNYLESSTVHGLGYISTTRRLVKLFWIAVVITGFTGAGVMIYQSFDAWEESPVKTTIETQPITEITFPKVTVCPPKNTYTDLKGRANNRSILQFCLAFSNQWVYLSSVKSSEAIIGGVIQW